jgi:hypothetical protein
MASIRWRVVVFLVSMVFAASAGLACGTSPVVAFIRGLPIDDVVGCGAVVMVGTIGAILLWPKAMILVLLRAIAFVVAMP